MFQCSDTACLKPPSARPDRPSSRGRPEEYDGGWTTRDTSRHAPHRAGRPVAGCSTSPCSRCRAPGQSVRPRCCVRSPRRRGPSTLDLDDPATQAAVEADPITFASCPDPVFIDEYQHVPMILDVIKAEIEGTTQVLAVRLLDDPRSTADARPSSTARDEYIARVTDAPPGRPGTARPSWQAPSLPGSLQGVRPATRRAVADSGKPVAARPWDAADGGSAPRRLRRARHGTIVADSRRGRLREPGADLRAPRRRGAVRPRTRTRAVLLLRGRPRVLRRVARRLRPAAGDVRAPPTHADAP